MRCERSGNITKSINCEITRKVTKIDNEKLNNDWTLTKNSIKNRFKQKTK